METEFSPLQPIGIFDSGVGGLSVLKAIRQILPNESVYYFGDQAHIPYGPRHKEEIKAFSVAITNFLYRRGAKLVVVACNTASAAALHYLREKFPNIPIVGMEPAVKPAAETTQTGKVGVLATPTTFSGELYASVVERFGQHVEIFTSTCPGLVEEIEAGNLESARTREILKETLTPMLEAGIDTVVMGCTHYPFVIPVIQSITGPEVRIIDPAPAIARQVGRLLEQRKLLNSREGRELLRFYSIGDANQFSGLVSNLLEESGEVIKVYWDKDQEIQDIAVNHPE
jgi:glutamate racemase